MNTAKTTKALPKERDNFSAPVRRELGRRVNHRCCFPDCWKSTLGPSESDPNKSIDLGKGAHITAAAPGGPRYDPKMSAAERSSINNGIWLCSLHAELIDKDVEKFPTEQIREWKKVAEARASREAFTTQPATANAVSLELDDEDKEFFRSLLLPDEDTTEKILADMIPAARKSLETFINSEYWPNHAVLLGLTLNNGGENLHVTHEGIAHALGVVSEINVVSAPGTGKTTTLIQLANSILDRNDTVTLFIPLREWNPARGDWFEWITQNNAFRAFKPQHLMKMAYEGRLVLLLDGWNELNPDDSITASRDLQRLKREYPQLGIVVGTRQNARPIDGSIVHIDGLNEDQQREIASHLRGDEGQSLIDQAQRTAGIRDLVSIPLYLTAFLTSTPDGNLPETKESILSGFVERHESAQDKAEILRSQLSGLHRYLLISLAIKANQNASAYLSIDDARSAAAQAIETLVANKQTMTPPDLTKALDALVASHLLVRSASSDETFTFQHQQFQEWYASFGVERLIIGAAQGNTEEKETLRRDVLNWLSWEESVLFACERLSRKNAAGASAVAAVIQETLGIDPMLAAEMIYRSSSDAWPHIEDHVQRFVQRWHRPGTVDRAVRFMITTGKPEFADKIWPLLETPDAHAFISTIRSARRFRPSVLGQNALTKLQALPDRHQADLVAEIADYGDYDGIELSAAIAKGSTTPRVVLEILKTLHFRDAFRHVTDILKTASDAVWKNVASSVFFGDLSDPDQANRYKELRQEEFIGQQGHVERLSHILHGNHYDGNAEEDILNILASPDYPTNNNQAQNIIYDAYRKHAPAVTAAMVRRLENSLELPHGPEGLLDSAPTFDNGPIIDALLSKTAPPIAGRLMGTAPIGQMIDEYLNLDGTFNKTNRPTEEQRQQLDYLQSRISISQETPFIKAIIQRGSTKDSRHIEALSDLLFRHGGRDKERFFRLEENDHQQLVDILLTWSEALISSEGENRGEMASLMQAMRRLPSPAFVPALDKMLQRDMELRKQARAAWQRSGGGQVPPAMSTCYHTQYRQTFAAIGGEDVIALMKGYLPDLQFGVDAARVLLDLWHIEHPIGERPLGGWYNYSNVRLHRINIEEKSHPQSSDFAEAIFEAATNYGKPEEAAEKQLHAIKLVCLGFRMPFGVPRPEFDMAVNLPQPYAAKQELFIVAALSGMVIPVDHLLAAFEELMELAQTDSWRLDENRGELMTWVELFAFSDNPLSVLEVIGRLPRHANPVRQLQRLITALGHSPHAEALAVLKEIARQHPDAIQDYEWQKAVFKTSSEDAGLFLLDTICNLPQGRNAARLDADDLFKKLTIFIEKYPQLREKTLERFRTTDNPTAKGILVTALAHVADPQITLSILQHTAEINAPYRRQIVAAVEKMAIGQRKSADWEGAFELFSVPVTEFRKALFDLLPQGGTLSELAAHCLTHIDVLRDEHGHLSNEPKHPNIETHLPWPIESSLDAANAQT